MPLHLTTNSHQANIDPENLLFPDHSADRFLLRSTTRGNGMEQPNCLSDVAFGVAGLQLLDR